MTLEEALEVLGIILVSQDVDFERNARIVTRDGETFWVEWFEGNYWRDYLSIVTTRAEAAAALKDPDAARD